MRAGLYQGHRGAECAESNKSVGLFISVLSFWSGSKRGSGPHSKTSILWVGALFLPLGHTWKLIKQRLCFILNHQCESEMWRIASQSCIFVWAQCVVSIKSTGHILALALPWICYHAMVCPLTLWLTFHKDQLQLNILGAVTPQGSFQLQLLSLESVQITVLSSQAKLSEHLWTQLFFLSLRFTYPEQHLVAGRTIQTLINLWYNSEAALLTNCHPPSPPVLQRDSCTQGC